MPGRAEVLSFISLIEGLITEVAVVEPWSIVYHVRYSYHQCVGINCAHQSARSSVRSLKRLRHNDILIQNPNILNLCRFVKIEVRVCHRKCTRNFHVLGAHYVTLPYQQCINTNVTAITKVGTHHAVSQPNTIGQFVLLTLQMALEFVQPIILGVADRAAKVRTDSLHDSGSARS